MKRWILPLLSLGWAAALAASAAAFAAAQPDPTEQIRRFVTEELARNQAGLRAQITVGEIDARLHLVPCDHTEVFLRPGGRLWGRSFVGYRCLQRSGWSVSVPVDVRLFGPGVVAAQALPALQPIVPGAVRLQEIEVTREAGGVVSGVEQLEDHICTRALEPGQPVPLNCLRSAPAVGQGEPVKLVAIGNGFSISTEATALATVSAGELVRVRTESGRTISGTARRGRVVEVNFQ